MKPKDIKKIKEIHLTDMLGRIDTGWDCCVCKEVARVHGSGFTWCKKHWEDWNLGTALTEDGREMLSIAKMRDKLK